MSSPDEMAPGEIARWLERLDKGQQDLLSRFDLVRSELVTRTEWDLQNRVHAQDVAETEDRVRTLSEQVATHRDAMSRMRGVQWVLGLILGVVVTVVASYIQSGRPL
ncbi:MAG: hypothetical protein M0Z51_16800 [Propionibacterium sp.]|nr:hypothetical protein [Propionibacterium sp.]